jgi:hypothetical protein
MSVRLLEESRRRASLHAIPAAIAQLVERLVRKDRRPDASFLLMRSHLLNCR